MDIRNCIMCGKLFNYITGPSLCPKCSKSMEDKFHEVKQYIYDNPGIGIAEVAEHMEVSVRQIKQWVREERLEFTEGSVTGITCESCGTPIRTGRFCKTCKDNLMHSLGHAYKDTPKETKPANDQPKSAKMRFF